MFLFFASFTASSETLAALSEIAGVIPVIWNQSTSEKTLSQSKSDTSAQAIVDPARS